MAGSGRLRDAKSIRETIQHQIRWRSDSKERTRRGRLSSREVLGLVPESHSSLSVACAKVCECNIRTDGQLTDPR